jgi:hypothetical protein
MTAQSAPADPADRAARVRLIELRAAAVSNLLPAGGPPAHDQHNC